MEQTKLAGLIQRAREGDRQAQESLILDVQDRIYYHCRKMMRNESDAQDAAQDVLIIMTTTLDKLREPAAFYRWVNGIAANRCRELVRQDARRRETQFFQYEDGDSALDDLEELDKAAIPEAVLEDKETQRLMLELINGLPPAQRESVLFYYYDRMEVKDIARIMEVSEGTVKSRLNYARKAIRAGVEELERTQNFKFYGLMPEALMAFMLRREAETLTLAPEQSARMVSAALAAAQAGMTAAAVAAMRARTRPQLEPDAGGSEPDTFFGKFSKK